MKIVAIIPAYNEQGAIVAAVQDAAAYVDAVVVVDDCSGDRTHMLARTTGAYVLHHMINRGQGAALQTGTDYALNELAADVIVHFDSDGQMMGQEIPMMIQPIVDGDVDVVLGSRFLGKAMGIPFSRKIILKGAILFTYLMSGIRLTDTHNGFRALSRYAAGQINIKLDRMAHGSDILDQIALKKLSFREMPVTIIYTEETLANGRTQGAIRVAYDFIKGKIMK